MSQLRGSQNYIWNLSDVLGQGATGSVYKCRHKKTGELYAVKTFNSHSHLRPLEIQMREFDVLKKLRHENIVQLHDIEQDAHARSQVLIMDLCTGGSLFSILDDPENAYGLEETEFLCVLRDVAAGIKHLRDNNIVHRDIKPGNIMRYITDDGRSIYKLIDFGAARQLQDEEQFMSLYGTEEYLYPDMYERAVLRRPTDRQFTAAVDLWSVGVTLYHVATGQLPFRPYGGIRRNKEVMYMITGGKWRGAISGVQHTDGGPIEYSNELPQQCRLSRGLKQLVTPLLAALLEHDISCAMSFDNFFTAVQRITSKTVVHVFHVADCCMLHIYCDTSCTLGTLQASITEQTQIDCGDQQILHENRTLSTMSPRPHTSPSNPLYLFTSVPSQSTSLSSSDNSLLSTTIPVLPDEPRDTTCDVHVDSDALFVKNACGIVYFHRRLVHVLLLCQHLLSKAAKMYRLVLQHQVDQIANELKGFQQIVGELGHRVHVLSTSHSMLLSAVRELSSVKHVTLQPNYGNLPDVYTQQTNRFRLLQQQVDEIGDDIINNLRLPCQLASPDASWLDECRCEDSDYCAQKADILVSSLKHTLADFVRDRSIRRLSFNEEQIHKFEKRKAKSNVSKSTALVERHCLPNTRNMFEKFVQSYREMYSVQCELVAVKRKLEVLLSSQENFTQSLTEFHNEQSAELEAMLTQLGVRVEAFPNDPVSTSSSSQHSGGHFITANGEFIFQTRHRTQLHDILERLTQNSRQMATIRNMVEDNEKCLSMLQLQDKN